MTVYHILYHIWKGYIQFVIDGVFSAMAMPMVEAARLTETVVDGAGYALLSIGLLAYAPTETGRTARRVLAMLGLSLRSISHIRQPSPIL